MDWIGFLTFVLVSSGTPGPNNITTMSNASKLGIKKSLPHIFATFAGFTILMIICVFITNYLHNIFPIIEKPMLICGGLYMLYLAWKILKSNSEIVEEQKATSPLGMFFFQFINPKLYVYYFVSFEAYILPIYQNNIPILLAFVLLLSAIGLMFLFMWGFFGSIFKKIFQNHGKITNIVMSILLVYCAISLFL